MFADVHKDVLKNYALPSRQNWYLQLINGVLPENIYTFIRKWRKYIQYKNNKCKPLKFFKKNH
jgi:hypothetical protein